MSGEVTYQVEIEGLSTHSKSVAQVASGVEEAVAAAETTLGTEASSLLCAFLPPFISATQASTADTVRALAEQTRSTSSRLRAMADNYGATESAAESGYHGARADVTPKAAMTTNALVAGPADTTSALAGAGLREDLTATARRSKARTGSVRRSVGSPRRWTSSRRRSTRWGR